LETREISPQPKIYDEPVSASVGNEGDQAPFIDHAQTTTDLNPREGPGPDYLKVETMAKGTNLVVLEKQGKWWRVRSTASNTEGWINGTFVVPK
jgi:SH3-like domain-containing protein